MSRRKRSEFEQDFLDRQVCTYTCGVAGCEFTYTAEHAVWLRVRDCHRAEAHPGYQERRRRPHTIRGLNRNVRYEAAA